MSIKLSKQSLTLVILVTVLVSIPGSVLAAKDHIINFRSPNLYPEGLAWDPSGQHFLVGSLRQRTIAAVSDAGVAETLITDSSLPENVSILGMAVDSYNNRLLAAVHATKPLPPFNALAAYDLRSKQRIFLAHLPIDDEAETDAARAIANDVAVDYRGNAYVTNAAGNYIWKVNDKGEAWIFSKSKQYTAHPVDRTTPYSFCGLNGIAYVSKGYLLVVQSNTGKMFKVDADDGTARLVLLNEDLMAADDIAIRRDGVVLVVSQFKLWFLKSQDSWAEGVVFDNIDLDVERFPTSVVVGEKDRVYVLYGHVNEGEMENSPRREIFSIVEMRSTKEDESDNVMLFVLIGIGLAWFLVWRFQMRQLVTKMDKKIN
ncbi:hypothetical protein L6164_001608 [Bauhinia variegata]|uniref:Uncharacterized protein n=1 Tax=Bauhinia variegata TaxID=167791 RepID=A0ACB9Q9A7_BAUVA|nr:hypothetical protein L6164_001608 [Bauhinia variegata]